MTLNSHFAFRVESFSMNALIALVLRHDCFKMDGNAYTVSGKPTVCGFRRYKPHADIRRGSLERWCQIRVRSSKLRVLFFDRYIFCMKFPNPHWLYISKFARLCAVSRRQHGSCYFRAYQRQRTLHGVGVITKLYFAIFAAFKEAMTLNLAQRSSKDIHFGVNRKHLYDFI